ncbi:hypothetical protein [Mesoplasma melaleucae]|uniref:Uncharacterized protein n=2 Tax=Mesoplasma melaleucae TaxID=81459 RepID=A0A2K8NYH3_9MOLU|nr:hypothetical protein [Mesoplasma melaleucae]ATZ17801.1 hypothetical protein EMELA_v1c02280 [Mesoplasma melaleucae]
MNIQNNIIQKELIQNNNKQNNKWLLLSLINNLPSEIDLIIETFKNTYSEKEFKDIWEDLILDIAKDTNNLKQYNILKDYILDCAINEDLVKILNEGYYYGQYIELDDEVVKELINDDYHLELI